MAEGDIVRNSGNDAYGDPEVLNSVGLGHLLVLFWTTSEWKNDNKGREYYERAIDPNQYHIIGCDDDETTKLLLYRSHFVGSTIRWYQSDTCTGVIDRVFNNDSPEMSPNISFYSKDEYPHRDFALSCGIRSSFCLPFTVRTSYTYFGVMEIVSTCNQDVVTLKKFCQSFKGFDWPFSFRDIDVQKYAVQEIDQLLEVVSQTFQLPLTQYWNYGDRPPYLVHQLSCRVFENLAPWCEFRDACFHKGLDVREGPIGSSCETPGVFFCRDITSLSITQYPFAHYARNCGSITCFTMYLYNISRPYEKWILEFFLPAQEMDNDYPQILLNSLWATIKECLPDWILASGEQLGQMISVKVINSSTHTEPQSFKIGHSSPPHLEGSGCTHTLNLFENGSGQNSNSYYNEKAATGEMSERVPSEAFQPRTFEEHLEIRGNTMDSERVDEMKECTEPQSLTSQPRRSKKIIRDEGYIIASESDRGTTADELVEVSSAEDLEYDKTSALKKLKISETSFILENIRKHFGRPQKDAAESFGVSLSTFKRNCRLVGITRWQPGKRKLIYNETGQRNFSSGMPRVQDTLAVEHTSQEPKNMDVKVMYNGVPIRFEIPTSSGITELENNVIERLPLNRKSFSIKYQDDEGDWVLIACDKDVQKCLKISRSLKKTTIKMLLDPPVI